MTRTAISQGSAIYGAYRASIASASKEKTLAAGSEAALSTAVQITTAAENSGATAINLRTAALAAQTKAITANTAAEKIRGSSSISKPFIANKSQAAATAKIMADSQKQLIENTKNDLSKINNQLSLAIKSRNSAFLTSENAQARIDKLTGVVSARDTSIRSTRDDLMRARSNAILTGNTSRVALFEKRIERLTQQRERAIAEIHAQEKRILVSSRDVALADRKIAGIKTNQVKLQESLVMAETRASRIRGIRRAASVPSGFASFSRGVDMRIADEYAARSMQETYNEQLRLRRNAGFDPMRVQQYSYVTSSGYVPPAASSGPFLSMGHSGGKLGGIVDAVGPAGIIITSIANIGAGVWEAADKISSGEREFYGNVRDIETGFDTFLEVFSNFQRKFLDSIGLTDVVVNTSKLVVEETSKGNRNLHKWGRFGVNTWAKITPAGLLASALVGKTGELIPDLSNHKIEVDEIRTDHEEKYGKIWREETEKEEKIRAREESEARKKQYDINMAEFKRYQKDVSRDFRRSLMSPDVLLGVYQAEAKNIKNWQNESLLKGDFNAAKQFENDWLEIQKKITPIESSIKSNKQLEFSTFQKLFDQANETSFEASLKTLGQNTRL